LLENKFVKVLLSRSHESRAHSAEYLKAYIKLRGVSYCCWYSKSWYKFSSSEVAARVGM